MLTFLAYRRGERGEYVYLMDFNGLSPSFHCRDKSDMKRMNF